MRRGFTLVESVAASAILVLVLGAMGLAAKAYWNGRNRVEARKEALALAAAEISSYEGREQPGVPMTASRIVCFLGEPYWVRTVASEEPSGAFRLEVGVSSPVAGEVGLVRMYYPQDGGM